MSQEDKKTTQQKSESLEDLELTTEKADDAKAGTAEESGASASKGWFRYTTSSP